MRLSLLFIFLGLLNTTLFAQKDSMLPPVTVSANANTDAVGILKGKAKDSVYNFMLTSATVAVYKDADSSLLQYTLPNNFGEFTVNKLPVNTPLRLIITHIGYKDLVKKVTIPGNKNELDVGLQYLHQLARDSSGKTMEEVVVKAIAPVRMNGDTLEFNFDAFRAAPNTTVEDQIRNLPGMVIWGDGEITFNGKKIQQILVDGKPFMGSGDATVATQNLPKNAVEKMQVYQQRNEKNPLDSTMYANLKLKEDKKMGYFGKVGGGYGTGNRYASDAMLNGFNKKLQIATVAGANNVNKIARDIEALIRNNSYQGEGTNIEYQSDFSMRGVNKPIMGGARFQYDFIPDVQYQKSSRLSSDYFINHNHTDVMNTNLEKNFITENEILSSWSNSSTFNQSSNQRANARYDRSAERYSLSINASGSINEDENKTQSQSTQEKTGIGVINKSNANNESYNNEKSIQAGFSFTKQEELYYSSKDRRRIPTEFTMGYNLIAVENNGRSKSQTTYEFANEPQRNSSVSRLYDKRNGGNTGHHFTISYPRLKELIFGRRSLRGINMELSANYDVNTAGNTDVVRDLASSTNTYGINTGLSYNSTIVVKDFKPALQLSKYFYQGLTNRYNKYVTLNLNAIQQYYSYNSSSTQAVQNIGYHYQNFIPNASVEYSNHQYGSYEVTYSIRYNSNMEYPNIGQMAPLVDAANPLYLPMGNQHLKPGYRQSLEFKYTFTTRTPKNPWNADVHVSIGKTKDNIVDSTLYDDGGGRTVYMTNINGNKYLNSNIHVRKALAINKNNTFEFGMQYNFDLFNDPRYINSKLNTSFNRNRGGRADLSYRYRDIVNIKLEQGLNYYDAEQRGFNNNRFKSKNQYSRAIATLQFPKNLVWSSNITYNRSAAGSTDAVNFTIWNASLTYRFLKGNNGEVKFSALDLLKQNKGITNTVNGNVQTFGYTNVLQQYFMLTISYFPRQFGK